MTFREEFSDSLILHIVSFQPHIPVEMKERQKGHIFLVLDLVLKEISLVVE